MRKKALVTGAAGQDGSYMCDLLIDKGYDVYGLVRPSGNRCYEYLEKLRTKGTIIWADIMQPGIFTGLTKYGFDEIYHFAAVSHVSTSFSNPLLTFETNLMATANLLEAFYQHDRKVKIYIASSSEMYGWQPVGTAYGIENQVFNPCSPYGVSKVAAHHLAKTYRDRGMFIVRGIAFNHESRRRGENFVTRKIGLSLRETGKVVLGNLDAVRDWHHAKDTVIGIWLATAEAYSPMDYTFASGTPRSVRQFAQAACAYFNLDFEEAVTTTEATKRSNDISYLCGHPGITLLLLGWQSQHTFKQLVEDCCAPKQKSPAFRL